MHFSVITLFPEMIYAALKEGVVARALLSQKIKITCFNPRDYATDAHRTVDDRPFGGGPGMVMMAEPLACAIDDARAHMPKGTKVIYCSPQGQRLSQAWVNTSVQSFAGLIMVCGRYEGVDERLLEAYVDEEVSIGDYVLSGGELPALVMIDAMARQCSEVLGNAESKEHDSFQQGLLDYPHYTRPAKWRGREVPEVLQSGHHKNIAAWRYAESLKRTEERRPDLLKKMSFKNVI